MNELDLYSNDELERMLQSEFLTSTRAEKIRSVLSQRASSGRLHAESSPSNEITIKSDNPEAARNEIDPPAGLRELQGLTILAAAVLVSALPVLVWWLLPLGDTPRRVTAFSVAAWAYWQALEPWLSGQFSRSEHKGERALSQVTALLGTAIFVVAYWRLYLAGGAMTAGMTFLVAKALSFGIGLVCYSVFKSIVRTSRATAAELAWATALYRRGILLPKLLVLGAALFALWRAV